MANNLSKRNLKNPEQFEFYGEEPDLRPYKTFRLAVSGDVLLNRLEVEIVDRPEFQRLRRIRQLGTAMYVYPSAQHTRFEHSLGTLCMAEMMVGFIKINQLSSPEEREISLQEHRLVRLVALLHDIGNIPFGHSLEDETCVISSHQEDKTRLERFIGNNTAIGNKLLATLGTTHYDFLLKILTAEKREVESLGKNAYIYDLVKNTVCADLLEYLHRDAYFTNLSLGFGDRFLKYMFIANKKSSKGKPTRRVAIRLWKKNDESPRADILSELIQLLHNRYFLAERIYFHHTKIISTAILAKAVYHAMKPDKGEALTLDDLYKLGDDELLTKLYKSKDSMASYYAKALIERKLYKRLYSLKRSTVEGEHTANVLNKLKEDFHINSCNRIKTEAEIANLCGLEPQSVIIYCPNPKMNLKPADMLVTWQGGFKPLKEIDDKLSQEKIHPILNSHKNLWQLQVFIEEKYQTNNASKRKLLVSWCKYYFEHDLRNGPSLFDVVKETILDIGHEIKYSFATAEIEKLATHWVSKSASGAPLTREDLKKSIKSTFKKMDSKK